MRTRAPIVWSHFPALTATVAAMMVIQMNTNWNAYAQNPVSGREEGVERGQRDERERPSDPDRVRRPVEERADRRERGGRTRAYPLVRAALLGESRAELGREQGIGQEEEDPEEDQPGEGLGPEAAVAPIVSNPTIVQSRKNRMSRRPMLFLSFFFSSTAYWVVISTDSSNPARARHPPPRIPMLPGAEPSGAAPAAQTGRAATTSPGASPSEASAPR